MDILTLSNPFMHQFGVRIHINTSSVSTVLYVCWPPFELLHRACSQQPLMLQYSVRTSQGQYYSIRPYQNPMGEDNLH